MTKNVKKCSKIFRNKSASKGHLVKDHEIKFTCKYCSETFDESVKFEVHLNSHQECTKFKCGECDKEFNLKWRLKKHKTLHQNDNIPSCHYYNNSKNCPFDEIGCKFLHKDSRQCKFNKTCTRNLCQYKHDNDNIISTDKPKDNVKENDKSNDDEVSEYDYEFETDEEDESDDDVYLQCNFYCDQCDASEKSEKELLMHQKKVHGCQQSFN